LALSFCKVIDFSTDDTTTESNKIKLHIHMGVAKMPVNKLGNWSLWNLILFIFFFKVKLSSIVRCLIEHRKSLLCLDMCYDFLVQ